MLLALFLIDAAAGLYLRMAIRRFDRALSDLGRNDDTQTTETADAVLRHLSDDSSK